MAIRVGINGFGRIGKCVVRLLLESDDLVPVLINDLDQPEDLIHLFRHDSVHGHWRGPVSRTATGMRIDDKGVDIALTSIRNPEEVGWGDAGCDVVLECTGIFRDRKGAGRLLAGGAPKVIISAPAKQPDATVVVGVNQEALQPEHKIISNASCTTNCLAPVLKVLDENFGVEHGFMTTVHSYTNDQNLLDKVHKKDLRRARAAAFNMVPTSTGAATAVGLVLPKMAGRLSGMAIRVPTPDVSLVDLTVKVGRGTSKEEVNAAFESASQGALKGILGVSHEPLVSSDYIGNPHSSVVDALSTDVQNGDLVKILSWYDNEWGFSNRMLDLVRLAVG